MSKILCRSVCSKRNPVCLVSVLLFSSPLEHKFNIVSNYWRVVSRSHQNGSQDPIKTVVRVHQNGSQGPLKTACFTSWCDRISGSIYLWWEHYIICGAEVELSFTSSFLRTPCRLLAISTVMIHFVLHALCVFRQVCCQKSHVHHQVNLPRYCFCVDKCWGDQLVFGMWIRKLPAVLSNYSSYIPR